MSPVLASMPLGFQWQTRDPFLFCVHHDDRYPVGTDDFGPPPEMLQGREIGSDFQMRDGWRMYHGDVVPGFPRHPHRGFETVTIVRRGLLDHSDSMGAAARYGRGDVQWLTAGRGIQHAEMFPLLDREGPNPVELFQIWMNLPSTNKMVDPHFAMLWSHTIPTLAVKDDAGKTTNVTVVAGNYTGTQAPAPPPKSWAASVDNDVAIWAIKMQPGARWTLPAARAGANRTLYVFAGAGIRTSDEELPSDRGYELRPDAAVALENGSAETEMLLLQGRPINEPVARHGPFVMNTGEEIRKAYSDFRATQFGGWPWDKSDPVHAREERFAKHADGKLERPA
jgi:redox-sensitive bicupin YhaK (pirin superfamily)